MKLLLATILASAAGMATAAAAPTYVNTLAVPMGTDLSGLVPSGVNSNRLGGLASDLHYDPYSGYYYGLGDRGPGGGTLDYNPRVHKFSLTVDGATGAISNFQLAETILFKQANGTPFTGLSPDLDPMNGNSTVLGRSLDPEGFVISRTGTYFVADEYGPSVYEFSKAGTFIRAFTAPANILPSDFAAGDPATGRQGNRGYEGLAMTPDGKYLIAALQDPIEGEGPGGLQRRGRNVRLVKYDVATGQAVDQFVYQLESRDDLNARATEDFGANSQGRNIGISSIVALDDERFIVLERDNRGIGVENPAGLDAALSDPASKRLYLIDTTGATDVSATSLNNVNDLAAAGITPVSKVLYLDILQALRDAGQEIFEKVEGLTFGPDLLGGGMALIIGTDNDFSVTQNANGVQFDVCAGPDFGGGNQVALDSGCPAGTGLIPNMFWSFALTGDDVTALGLIRAERLPVPEPTALALFGLGLGGLSLVRRRARA